MILIAGSPATVDTSGWQPMARHIYEIKQRSPVRFEYESEHHLWFEMLLRAEIVEAARSLNESGVPVPYSVRQDAMSSIGFSRRRAGFACDRASCPLTRFAIYSVTVRCTPLSVRQRFRSFITKQFWKRSATDNLTACSKICCSTVGTMTAISELIQEHVSPRLSVPGDVLYFRQSGSRPQHARMARFKCRGAR